MLVLLVSFTWETSRMSINLIESEHRTQKSVRSTFVSVAVHACVITLAVYASANATEVVAKSRPDTVTVFYPKTATTSETPRRSTADAPTKPTPAPPPVLRKPIDFTGIPKELPPVDPATTIIDDGTLFGTTPKGDGGVPGTGLTGNVGDSGEPFLAAQVEKPALARNGNPSPKYPSLLEQSRVEGTVLVQFVVDTLGSADMRTFRVLDATNDLFAESTRATLAKWRFYPAEAGGRKVKQIVQLPLRFVAPAR